MTHVHAWVTHQRILGEGNVPLIVEACACGQTRTRQMEPDEHADYIAWRRQITERREQGHFSVR